VEPAETAGIAPYPPWHIRSTDNLAPFQAPPLHLGNGGAYHFAINIAQAAMLIAANRIGISPGPETVSMERIMENMAGHMLQSGDWGIQYPYL
jgi:hypothetical protein